MFAGGFSLRAWVPTVVAQDGLGLVSEVDRVVLAIGWCAYRNAAR